MPTQLLLLVLGQFVFLLGVFWILAYYLIQRKRLRLEERSRILDRFTSGAELQAFLASEAGSRLFNSMLSPRKQGRQLVAQTYGVGLTLICISFGFLALAALGVVGDKVLLVPGFLALATGTGVSLSAWVAQRLLRGEGTPERTSRDEL